MKGQSRRHTTCAIRCGDDDDDDDDVVRVRCTAILVSIMDNEIEGRGRVADKSCGVVGARAWDVLRIILTSPLEAVLKLCGRRVVKLPAPEMWRRAGWAD